jgi:hypothetical protein
MVEKANDITFSWGFPFSIGKYYNIHWRMGIDFMHMSFMTSEHWKENEGIVLRFNYTDTREYYNIGKWYMRSLQ